MSPSSLLTLSYWFGFPPTLSSRAYWIFVVLVLVIFFGGVAAALIGSNMRNAWQGRVLRRLGKVGAVWGIIAALLFFFRTQRIPFFSLRLWLGLWLIGIIVHTIFVVTYLVRRLPSLKEEADKRAAVEKYLPH